MISSGQKWALEQLKDISAKSDGNLEIVEVIEPADANVYLRVSVSVDCSGYHLIEGGIPFRPRERLLISIPSQFPLDLPTLRFTHSDYGGFPHVQWGSTICLYQSSETEWQPDDGMFGFVQRIHEWLRAGAANQLDPIGLPLHPPVAYQHGIILAVVPTQNTPVPEPPWWAGFAKIARENEVCLELSEWLERDNVSIETRVAPTILLPSDMPFEYPETIAALKTILGERGISLEIVRLLLSMGALRNPDGKPLVFILGAAMRGISGGERKQHLAAWRIKAEQALELRNAVLAATEGNPVDEHLFQEWTERASIDWCSVLEDRPEIIIQRDTGTPAQFWRGRHVAIIGCGAIGSTIAMFLTRAGVMKLQLYDNDRAVVKPGLLVRQIFDRYQIGLGKAYATRNNVRYIDPKIDVVAHQKNILSVLRDTDMLCALFEADVIINATASIRVASALEYQLRDWPKKHPPILSMIIGHQANAALMTLAQDNHAGVTQDLNRRLKLELANSPNGNHLLNEFWPSSAQASRLFQPEPGCSDPTFVGSATDIAVLTGRMLNVASGWIAKGVSDRAYSFGIYLPAAPQTIAELPLEAEYSWPPDSVYSDPRHDYQTRLSPAAEAAMLSWIRKSERQRGVEVETGGVLFGQFDDFLKVIWVTAASGPPPDSTANRNGFVCGTHGVAKMNQELVARSLGSVSFVGMWHTHPGNAPDPSPIDRDAMARLFDSPDFNGRHFLMLIIGGSSNAPIIAVNVFNRNE
jgi:integrative and conjugative element protein (TIGR02256 family)